MKQSCCFAKLCNREFNPKDTEVNLFSLELCVHENRSTILHEKGTKFVSRCWGLLLENFRVTAETFDKSRKLLIFLAKSEYHMLFFI